MRIAVLNGPNLNLLGTREPEIYGTTTLRDIESRLRQVASVLGVTLEFGQWNGEGDLIDAVQRLHGRCDGAIINAGAASVSATASHAVFSGKAIQRISDSPLQHVVVTNTIPLSEQGQACQKVRVKSVGRLLGEAIKRIHHGDSISSLFV